MPSPEPRIVFLPPRPAICIRYTAPAGAPHRGPDAGVAAHWRRFHELRALIDPAHIDPDVLAIAYAPPQPYGAPLVLDLCLPLAEGAPVPHVPPLTSHNPIPGGRFVLATAPADAATSAHRAARAYAQRLHLAVERGYIELYHPATEDGAVTVEAGVRIHE